MSQISTCSLTEAMYLLSHGNRVVSVQTECTWPYGHDECAFVFEGETVEADHESYLRGGIFANPGSLPGLFAAITAVLAKGDAS
jgi:hypothetical protein